MDGHFFSLLRSLGSEGLKTRGSARLAVVRQSGRVVARGVMVADHERRRSVTVLRERRGVIPLRHSPGRHLRAGAGRAAGHRRAAKAVGEIWSDASPGKDPAGRFPATGPEGRWAVPARHLQLAGLHPLLGPVPQGALGGEAEDGGGPLSARSQAHRELVSAVSARAGSRAVDGTQAAVGALCLFRYHRKFQSAPQLSAPGHRCVAQVVEPPLATGLDIWEELLRLLARYPLPQPRIRSSPVT